MHIFFAVLTLTFTENIKLCLILYYFAQSYLRRFSPYNAPAIYICPCTIYVNSCEATEMVIDKSQTTTEKGQARVGPAHVSVRIFGIIQINRHKTHSIALI